MHFCLHFCFASIFSHLFSKLCSPPSVGSTFLKNDSKQSAFKNVSFESLLDAMAPSVPLRRALFRVPFPFYPLHAPQAGIQKSLQICVLLLQVASLDDLNHVSDIILMTSSCMRHYVGDILTYPTWFETHFLHFGKTILLFFWKCAPRLHRKHNSRWRHKAFLIKNHTFSTSPAPPARVGGSGGGVLFRALTLNK